MSSGECELKAEYNKKKKKKQLPIVDFQLLATVLSQSAKAKEHLLEHTKSMDQPAGKSVTPAEGHRSSFWMFDKAFIVSTKRVRNISKAKKQEF